MNIRFCGFGGQGIVLSGYIMGNAALEENLNALQTQSYGSESRGGASKSDVIISKEDIHEIEIDQLDVLVAFSQPAYEMYIDKLRKRGILIIEDDLVKPDSDSPFEPYRIKATDIAFKKFGRKIMANTVMLGFITPIVKAISGKSMEKAVEESAPRGTEEKNLDAFSEGYKLGLIAVKEKTKA
ncbi:MAG: 2-oxoacid:acceptor oxidoreductase family protein [Candidatus Marinimicrobia bacterium]|nr:2-oxoacid:acceptor oxidoreductase family protein [Candidatus Neomarinimicrobiota bacterium]MBL7046288.1 2-oxoacid:acceptor oxidoreductase family protein [Candidatus Neomarinimicrobiota bacterium]